ncbi:hypothetical protein NPIL_74391 [Nephila pilipes]|uniref:Uncharacterized protein n=1 Tax=Nephila pilipes TaxID=299642 RepID=A0A8X6PQQ0_NEPPI|nr:hypothetical protein NPIL_74391 [Nephila pilipes]
MNKNDHEQQKLLSPKTYATIAKTLVGKPNRFRGAKLRGVFYRKLSRQHTAYVIDCSLAKLFADCDGRVTAAGHYSDGISTSRHCRQGMFAKKSNSPPSTRCEITAPPRIMTSFVGAVAARFIF